MKKVLSAAAMAALVSAVSQASAQVLYEPFDYTAGDQLDANAATVNKLYTTSGTYWSERGNTQTGLFTIGSGLTGPTNTSIVLPGNVGNSALFPNNINHPANPPAGVVGRTPNVGLGQTFTAPGEIYYSLQLQVPTGDFANATAGNAIAGFSNFSIPGPTAIGLHQGGLRLQRTGTGSYQIGIQTAGGTTNYTGSFAPGETVFAVVRYTIVGGGSANDLIDLWVNPTSDFGSATAPALTSVAQLTNNQDSVDAMTPANPMIAGFFVRSSAITDDYRVDEVRVDTTWAGVTPDGNLQHGYNSAAGGNWSNWADPNWTNRAGAPPSATDAATVGHVANFDNTTASGSTITIDGGGRTVDTINLRNTGSLTIAGDALNALNFKSNTSAGQVYVYDGNHTIAAPITTEGNLSFKTRAGASLTLNDTVTATGANKVIGVYGRGTVKLGASERLDDTARLEVRSGTLDLNGGTETVGLFQLGTSHPNNGMAIAAGTLYNGDLASGSVMNGTLNATSYDLQSGTIGAVLTGTVGVTKNLAGFVELSGNNTYTGTTQVNSGTLKLSGEPTNAIVANLAVPPVVTGGQTVLAIDDNRALGPDGSAPTITWASTGGTAATLQLHGNFTLRSDAVLNITDAATMIPRFGAGAGFTGTIQHVFTGLKGIGVFGDGTIIFDAVNTYSGPLSMYSGTVLVGNQNQIGDGSATNDLHFNGGTFKQSAALGGITKDVRFIGAGTFDTNGIDATISGVLSDAGAFTKVGAGRLTLTNAGNSYTGRTNIDRGALRITTNTALGSSAATANNTVVNGGSDVTLDAVLEIDGSAGDLSVPEPISVQGKTSTSGGNATPSINNIAGNNTLTGPITMATGGTWYNFQSDAGKLTLSGITNSTGNTTGRDIHLRGAGDGEIVAGINGTGGAIAAILEVHKHGTGTWTVNGTSNYLGRTVLNGGVLAVASTDSLGSATNSIEFNGGILRTNGAVASTRNASVLAGGGTFDSNGFDSTLANVTGAGALSKNSAGKLTVNQLKLGGAASIGGGTLEVAANGTPANTVEASAVNVATGATLGMNDNDMIVNYTGASQEFELRDKVLLFRDGGGTEGIAFTRDIPNGDDKILAFGETSELGITEFNGVTGLDDTTVVGKYTYYGDANFDGQVTTDDYLAVDLGLGTGDSWVQGDFDLNGQVTTDDYVVVDLNLGKGTDNPLAYADEQAAMIALHTEMFGQSYVEKLAYASENGWVAASVPEPGAISLVGLGAMAMLGRRRRRA